MKIGKYEISIIGIILLVVPLAAVLIAYPYLPKSIPLQWSLTGKATRYGSKNFLFILGILPFLVYLRAKSKYKRK